MRLNVSEEAVNQLETYSEHYHITHTTLLGHIPRLPPDAMYVCVLTPATDILETLTKRELLLQPFRSYPFYPRTPTGSYPRATDNIRL
eukprot:1127695-Amphidinium_carterae.2